MATPMARSIIDLVRRFERWADITTASLPIGLRQAHQCAIEANADVEEIATIRDRQSFSD